MMTRKKCLFKIPSGMGLLAVYNILLVHVDYCLKNGYVPKIDFSDFIYKYPDAKEPWKSFFTFAELYEDPYEIEGEIELTFSRRPPLTCTSDPDYTPIMCVWNNFPEDKKTRDHLNKLSSYIKISTRIVKKAEEFIKEHFSDKNITGVHIRHTDHWRDKMSYVKGLCSFHPIEDYIRELRKQAAAGIYVATDSRVNIHILRFTKDLREKLIYNDFKRASGGQALHMGYQNYGFDPVALGEEVLIDTIILSRCDSLIGGISNITLTALFWNPSLPFTNIAQMVELADTQEKPMW